MASARYGCQTISNFFRLGFELGLAVHSSASAEIQGPVSANPLFVPTIRDHGTKNGKYRFLFNVGARENVSRNHLSTNDSPAFYN